MPFDPSQPFDVLDTPKFDAAEPHAVVIPPFDPAKPHDVVELPKFQPSAPHEVVDVPVTESMRPAPNRRLTQFNSSPLARQVSAWANPEPEQPKPDNSEQIAQVVARYPREMFDAMRERARNSGDWTEFENTRAEYKAKMAAAGAPVLEEPGPGEALNTPVAQLEKYTPSVQTVQDAFEYLRKGITHPFTPTVDLSGPSEKPGKAAQATAGGLKAVAKAGNFFTSPMGVLTMGSGAAPAYVQKLISMGFTVDMLSSTPELAKRFGEATVTGDTEQQVESLGDLLLNSAMAGEGVKHTVTPAKINLSRALAKELLHSKLEVEPVPEGTPGSPIVRNVDNLPPDGDVGAQLNTQPVEVVPPNKGLPRVPIKVVSPIEDNGSVNTPNLMEIAHDMRDRFEQIGLHGALSPQQKAMLSVLRPMLDNPQSNQTENLARFFGLKLDEAATDMPERYRYVTVSGLSKPQPQGAKAPAPQIKGGQNVRQQSAVAEVQGTAQTGVGLQGGEGRIKTVPEAAGTGEDSSTKEVVPAAKTSDILGANATPASASSAAERPQPVAAATAPEKAAPSGEPIVLNGRAFSKVGDKWFDATSGKQREVKKPGVVAQLDAIAESQAAAAAHPSTYDVGEEPTAGAPDKTDVPPRLPGASEVPRDTRVIDPASGYPIEDTDVDPKSLKLSADVPNFKSGAGDTGEVQGSELTGKYTRVGTGRTVVWERKDGTREVITGRHRWQLALRNGIKDFPVQILREADGFGRENALVLDAESNIRDNQGSVKDYAHFFRNTPYDEQTAAGRGLFREGPNAKGRDGFNIGKYANDSLYALFMADKIAERQASAIAKAAPNDENLQRVGVNAALSGANIGESVARIEAAKAAADASGKPKQFDFFADTSLEETWKKQGDYVAAERKRLQDIISTRRAIISKPEAAMGTGSIRAMKRGGKGGYTAQAELESAQQELERWQNWATDPDLSAKVKAASRGEQVPAATDKNAITTAKERPNNAEPEGEQPAKKADTGSGDMFGSEVPTKSPEQLAEEKRLEDQRLAIAAKQNKHLTGALDTTMVLPGTEGAAGEGDIPLLTQPKPKEAAKPEGFFTSAMSPDEQAELAQLEAALAKKLGQTSVGVDPEYFTLGARIASLYVKAGARKFRDFAGAMLQKFGDAARPYLISWYNHVRHLPGAVTEGMDTEAEAQSIYDNEFSVGRNDAAASGRTVPGANGNGGGKRVPIPRVVRAELIPKPRSFVGANSYGPATLDADQVLGINTVLTHFANNPERGAFLLGDGTGFGKTRQILGVIDQYRKKQFPGARVLYVTQNEQMLAGSWTRDAHAMGVDLRGVDATTYDGLKKMGAKDYDLAIFDEAHNLKNGQSGKAMAAARINAKHEMFATATPMDRPTGAAYFLAEITGESEEAMAKKLGYTYQERIDPITQEPHTYAVLLPDTTWKKVWANIMAYRDAAISAGAMLRREYPFYGTVKEHQVNWDDVHQKAANQIINHFDRLIESSASPTAKRNYAGQKTLASRRWSEMSKVPEVFAMAKKWVEDGGQVIVMAETDKEQSFPVEVPGGVEGVNDKGRPVWRVPGSLSRLTGLFEKMGVEVAHIHDTRRNVVSEEVDKFQNGKAPVALATPKSGGAGINLDDTVGNKPRLLIAMSPELAGDIFDQVLGRVSRKTTQSEATALLLFNGASWADGRSKEIRDTKIRTLRAIQGGEDVDAAGFDPSAEAPKVRNAPSAPLVASQNVPGLNWQVWVTKKGKTRYTAPVTPEFQAWFDNNPAAAKQLGISLSAWKGKTSAWTDHVPGGKGARGWESIEPGLATEPPVELRKTNPDVVAKGINDIRELFQSPETKLPQRTKDLALAMLDTPVMRELDWSHLQLALKDHIEGNYAGIAYPISDLIELSRAANSGTFPHEVFHLLHELLPERDKTTVDVLRREAIAKALERTDLSPTERKFVESLRDGQPVESDSFKREAVNMEFYRLINPSEFLASIAGDRFETDQWASRNHGFLKNMVNRVKGWVQGIVDAVRRVIGKRPDMDQIYRELLAGKHTERMAASIDDAVTRRGTFSRDREDALNSERLARTAEDKEVEASHQLAQSADIVDLLEKHGAGTAERRAQKLLSYTDYAGIREVGRRLNGGFVETYRQIKGRIADPFRMTWVARVANSKYEGFRSQIEGVIRTRDEEQQKLASPTFVRKMMRDQMAEASKNAADAALKNTTAIFNSAHIKAQRALEFERRRDRETAQLEGQLRQIEDAERSSTAMQQLLTDMVNVLSSTAEGTQMLSDPAAGNRTQMLKFYKELKQSAQQTLHHDTLLRWAAYILERNKDLRDALLAQQLVSQSNIRAQMSAYETQFLSELEANPVKAIAKAIRERVKLVTDRDKAFFAWREIHREVMEKLTAFDTLDEAARIATNVLNDPDWKSLRSEIAKDAKMIGNSDVAKPFQDGTILLPDGSEFNVSPKDMVGSKTRFDQNRARYEAARDTLDNWLNNPANIDDPNYGLHRRNYESITAYYTGLSMEQPSDPLRAFKRTFDIVKNAVEVAGGRLAPGARKALSMLDSDHHAAAAWTQRYTNSLAIATQHAIQSHGIEYRTFGGTSIHDANAIYYENMGNQLRYSFNRQAGGMKVGDLAGSGWKVTQADLDLVSLEAQAVSEGFKIVGDRQMTKDTLGGHTLVRRALKGNENMTVRTYTGDDAMLQFARDFDHARIGADEPEMLRLLDANWQRVGFGFTWDRNTDFSKATMFDGAGGAFEVLSDRMARNPAAVQNTREYFDALSALSTLTPDEAKAVVLQEWGRIIHDWAHEMQDANKVQDIPRSEDTKNSFTRSRNEAIAPYVFYENGFKTTSDVERFGLGVTSRAFDNVVDALKAQEQDMLRQRAEFSARVVEEMNASHKTLKESRYAVQHAAAMERANGRNYDSYANLEWRMKVLSDCRKLLDDTTSSLSDDATFARYVGNLTSMLIGTGATIRNVTLGPMFIGHLALRLGVSAPKAMVLSAWKGYLSPAFRLLPSLALTLGKLPLKGVEGAWHALSDKQKREAQGWIGTVLHPIVEELGETVYNRIKEIRKLQDAGVLHMHEATKQWDNALMGTWLTRGRILEKDYTTAQKIANLPAALIETGVLTFQRALMPQFGDTWLNMGVNMMMRSSAGPFHLWENALRRMFADYTSSRYRVFDFANLQSSVNRISHQEFFPRSITDMRATSSNADMVRLRQHFLDAGIDFDESAMRFLKELSNGKTDAQFLSDVERDRFVSSAIDFANRASLTNNPLRLRMNDWFTTLVRPFMQWKVRMLSNAMSEIAVPGQTSAPVADRMQLFKSRSFQFAALATTMVLPVLFFNAIIGASDEEENRVVKKALFNQVTGFRQPWERDNPIGGFGIYAMASVPFMDMLASTMLSDMPNRATFDPSLAMVEKGKDISRYVGGVMQTGDWTYRLPELIGGLFPDAKMVLNRLESQEGKRELNNIVALARRHGETDLLRPSSVGSSGGIQATPLSPFADKMVAAAMKGDTAEVKRVYDEAVLVAKDMGKAHPEQAVQSMFEGRNPYARVFRSQLTPEQRQEFLSRLSPSERAQVEDAEQRFSAGAAAIGASAKFQSTPRIATGSGGASGATASGVGVQVPSGGGSVGGGSRRPRLSAIGSPAAVRGIRRASGGRRPRLSGAGARGGSIRRIRGPRLSRFA